MSLKKAVILTLREIIEAKVIMDYHAKVRDHGSSPKEQEIRLILKAVRKFKKMVGPFYSTTEKVPDKISLATRKVLSQFGVSIDDFTINLEIACMQLLGEKPFDGLDSQILLDKGGPPTKKADHYSVIQITSIFDFFFSESITTRGKKSSPVTWSKLVTEGRKNFVTITLKSIGVSISDSKLNDFLGGISLPVQPKASHPQQ